MERVGHKLICQWLGIPAEAWPPDHYTLLGLSRGEPDIPRIELRVHERLIKLRCYQLSHPEQATEAMNRLARAFTCLTDPNSKRTYDNQLLGRASPPPAAGQRGPEQGTVPGKNGSPALGPAKSTGPGEAAGTSGWMIYGVWGQGTTTAVAALQSQAGPANRSVAPSIEIQVSPPPPVGPPTEPDAVSDPQPPAPPVDSLPPPSLEKTFALAAKSAEARRGLGTRRALYRRLRLTRKLMAAWRHVGKYVSRPTRGLARAAEANDLTRQLRRLQTYLVDFPPILGEAGQPGFFVASLAGEDMVGPSFRALDASRRELLARDWKDGQTLLRAHCRFLRGEVKSLKRLSVLGRGRRALRYWAKDHPVWTRLLVVGLVVAWVWLVWTVLAGPFPTRFHRAGL